MHAPLTRPLTRPLTGLLTEHQGATRGPQLVSNGTFDANITGWSALNANATPAWDAGQLKVTTAAATTGVYQRITTVAGRTYELKIDASCESGSFSTRATNGATPSATIMGETSTLTAGQSAAQTIQFIAQSADTCVYIRTGVASVYRADNVSVRQVL